MLIDIWITYLCPCGNHHRASYAWNPVVCPNTRDELPWKKILTKDEITDLKSLTKMANAIMTLHPLEPEKGKTP